MIAKLLKSAGVVCVVTLFLADSALHGQDQQAPATDGTAKVSYYHQVRPILQAHCTGCHQPAKPRGKYVMTAFDTMLAGGESGDPAIVLGKPDERT
jgi:mono/diheme cytochrome c family protein